MELPTVAFAEVPVSEFDDWEKKRKAEAVDEFKKEQKRLAKNDYERNRWRQMQEKDQAKYYQYLDKQMERQRQRRASKLMVEQSTVNDTGGDPKQTNEPESVVLHSNLEDFKDVDECNQEDEYTDDDDGKCLPVVNSKEVTVSHGYRYQTFDHLREHLANSRKVVEDSIMHSDAFRNMKATDLLKYTFIARFFETKYYYGVLFSYEKKNRSFNVIYEDQDHQLLERKEVILSIVHPDKVPLHIKGWGNYRRISFYIGNFAERRILRMACEIRTTHYCDMSLRTHFTLL